MNDLIAEPFITQTEDKAPDIMAFEEIDGVKYYHTLPQGAPEWLKLRLGMITASEMDKLLTPTLKASNNAATRTQLFELAAQRITQHVEPHYMSWDMERGHLEEVDARVAYGNLYTPVQECGFVINNTLGFDLGCSPDGLVGDLGMIEVKSRVAKYQVKTILEHIGVADAVTPIPVEYMLQVQTSLFITGREWCDFLSYSNGLNMAVIRCRPDEAYQEAIKKAAADAEAKIQTMIADYERTTTADGAKIHPVARNDYTDEINA